MADFEVERQLIRGSAADARNWVASSDLPEDERDDLMAFIANFDTLTFAKENDAILDLYATSAGVTLPPWFRAVRTTLAFVDPPQPVRVDDFTWHYSPASDDVDDLWFEMFVGYSGWDQRELLADRAGVYPIAGSTDLDDELYIGINLRDPQDRRIFDFNEADLRDDHLAGRSPSESAFPIFATYAQFLAHITEMRPLPES